MLACIACSKEGVEDGHRGASTPSTKGSVKSLSAQLKDMVLRFSGSQRQCKAGDSTSKISIYHRNTRPYPSDHSVDDNMTSSYGQGGTCSYQRSVSSGLTRSLEYGRPGHNKFRSNWLAEQSQDGEEEEKDMYLDRDGDEPKEWTAQVEPGVHITLVSIPGGIGNDLKRIRFSREKFDKWQAQRWWGDNFDRVMELYNVQTFSRHAFPTPLPGDLFADAQVGSSSETAFHRDMVPHKPVPAMPIKAIYCPPASVPDPANHILAHHFNLHSAVAFPGFPPDPWRATTSSRDEASVSLSNASDLETTEWIEEDEPGIYITIREMGDGSRELRRIRFSREKFGEQNAKVWWENNKERIHAQYL